MLLPIIKGAHQAALGLGGLAGTIAPHVQRGMGAIQRAFQRIPPSALVAGTGIAGVGLARPEGAEAGVPQPTPAAAGFRTVPHDFIGPLRPQDVRLPSPPSQPVTPMAAIERAVAQPGEFVARPPAPAAREAVGVPTAPTPAPTPAPLPPAPALAGGAAVGRMADVPTPAPLPPSPVLAGDIFQPERRAVGQPIGQFEAMIRALQAQQADPARFVQMPLMGEAGFGPAAAQERALRRLREQALERVLGAAAI